MRKKIILLLTLLTIGYASVVISLSTNEKVSLAYDNSNLQVIFKKVMLNNEENENIIISDEGKSFVYIADNLTSSENTANIEYSIKNQSSYYDANVAVSCSTDYNEYVEYDGNTLNQIVEIKADEGYTDTLTTKLKNDNTSSEPITIKCTLIIDPVSRDSIMLGKEYNVDFDANGGSTIDSSIIVKYYEKYGELPVPIKRGYEFLGWYTEDGVKIDASSLVKIKDNHTLIAKWKKNTFKLITDVDGDGRADTGDEIEVKNERFYVISQTATEINALAKYNLKVGGMYDGYTLEGTLSPSEEGYGIQDASMVGFAWQEGQKKYGTVALANATGWPNTDSATIDIKQYDGPVKDALYGEYGYEKYLQDKIPDISVRLITKGEIESLINDGNTLSDRDNMEAKADAKGFSWLYSTTYWTQSSYNNSFVWGVYSHGSHGSFSYFSKDSYNDKYWYGVRPVVTIPVELEDVFNITFNANGGNVININKEIKIGDKYGELPIPIKEGYEFQGWYTESREKIESTTLMKKYQDHTLTAKWRNPNLGYEISYDQDLDGENDIGDEIKVGTEYFYVISYNNTELNALAKYNLNVGSNSVPNATYGIQNENARGGDSGTKYGNVRFSKTTGWAPGADPVDVRTVKYRYDSEATKTQFSALDALYTNNAAVTGYEEYMKRIASESIKEKISIRLINKGEIENLLDITTPFTSGSNYFKDKADVRHYQWLYSTSYWTQTGFTNYAYDLFGVTASGYLSNAQAIYGDYYGVRPVITIPES